MGHRHMTFMERLAEGVRSGVVVKTERAELARHLSDAAVAGPGDAEVLGVVYPRSTADVAQIVTLAAAEGVGIVPQGGMSGLAGGGVPIGRSVVIAMEQMQAIETIDATAMAMTVQAGAVLATVQDAAKDADLFFPVDLGGRGSAQIGGMIATNAGGNRVLRYGMMRDQVLGLEVVLPDGTILSMLNTMLKNNSAYDLKHLFVGTEGTLGIITRAVLRLAPQPTGSATALCAFQDYAAVLELLARARQTLGPQLGSFEVMWPDFYHLGTAALGRAAPIGPVHNIYALVEALWHAPGPDDGALIEMIARAMEDGIVDDAVVATSVRQSEELWAIRECTSEFSRTLGPLLGFDVSIPTSRIAEFIEEHRRLVEARWPDTRTVYFGHVADSNLHIGLASGDNAEEADAMERATYDLVGTWGGAISAEHGIGVHKMPFLHHSRTPAEIAAMRLIKRAFDHRNIMNPGKVFDF